MLSPCCQEHLALERNQLGYLRTKCKKCKAVIHGAGLSGTWRRLPEPKDA
jgi:hypothetical protein